MPMHPAETTKVPTTMHDRFKICNANHSRTEKSARVGGGSAGTTSTMLRKSLGLLDAAPASTDESIALEAAVGIDR